MSAKPAVLVLHNRYREPGGEERSVSELVALLRLHGHRVELMERSSRTLTGIGGRARAGTAMLAGGLAPGEVATAVRRTGATIVHAHNVNPLLGPRALSAARRAGARVVMHLHNYRLVCAIGIAYRDGDVCTRCQRRNTLPGARLRCRGSLPEAAVYAAGISLNQERVLRAVDRFIVPSDATMRRLADLGLAGDRMDVLPNFLIENGFVAQSRAASGKYALFVGRLSPEKGVGTAIEAARRADVPLLVAGAGTDERRLRGLAEGAPVHFAGRLSAAALEDARRRAAFAVAPSRWDEPCPYAVIEAMAAGLPVLAAAVGGLPEMVGGDAALPPRAVESWAEAMGALWSDRRQRGERGAAALARARELFGADRFYDGLMEVYEQAGASRG